MRNDDRGNGVQESDHGASPRELLGRLTDLGMGEVAAAQLVLASPSRVLARAIDAFELVADDSPVDARAWITAAADDPQRIEAVLEQHRGWDAWHRMHRAWEAADAARAEEERRSHGWAAAVSDALGDEQLLRAVERVTMPIGVLGRRSIPAARAQLLAWAIAVRTEQPDVPLDVGLEADLAGQRTAPAPLDDGLPDPPHASGPDDLNARLAAALDLIAEVHHGLPTETQRTPASPTDARAPERALERSLDRGW